MDFYYDVVYGLVGDECFDCGMFCGRKWNVGFVDCVGFCICDLVIDEFFVVFVEDVFCCWVYKDDVVFGVLVNYVLQYCVEEQLVMVL